MIQLIDSSSRELLIILFQLNVLAVPLHFLIEEEEEKKKKEKKEEYIPCARMPATIIEGIRIRRIMFISRENLQR